MARVRLGTFRTLYERAMGDRGASSWWTNPFLRPACDRQSILGAIRNAARGVHRIARGKAERGSWIVSWDSVPATSFYVKTTGRLVDASTAVFSHCKNRSMIWNREDKEAAMTLAQTSRRSGKTLLWLLIPIVVARGVAHHRTTSREEPVRGGTR